MAQPIPLTGAVAEVAIVGAGLCGLALARDLHRQGRGFVLIDARPRLGGRAFSLPPLPAAELPGAPPCPVLDAGPTWFWPETEPRIAALLAALALPAFAQFDPGDALWLADPGRAPEVRHEAGGVHAGAHRIAGGVQSLVDALAARLPPSSLRLSTVVQAVHDHHRHVELQIESGGRAQRLRAQRVVIALPPRLAHEHLRFDPPLAPAVAEALAEVSTWMAAQAKALAVFPRPFWRAAGRSGNAFVRHAQAVLGEVFDATEPLPGGGEPCGVLGGFAAMPPAQRHAFRRGMAMLVESQFAQLFGSGALAGAHHWMDWAEERWTCSTADREQPPAPPQADPLLRQPHWQGRLLFGGSETATHGAGRMEGALDAAARLLRALQPMAFDAQAAVSPPAAAVPAMQRLTAGIAALRERAPALYRGHLSQRLAGAQQEQLTQRAVLATAEQVYSEALALLDGVAAGLPPGGPPVAGRHALTPRVLAAFDGWNPALVQAALAFNAGSCALSNFPHEVRLDGDALRALTLDLAAAWREFALAVNDRLLAQVPLAMAQP